MLVGVVMVAAGLAKFGFVTDLLSKPTQIGYMNGLVLTIVVGQLPKLLGFSVDADGLIAEISALFPALAKGAVNGTAAVVGAGSLTDILLLQRLKLKIPAVLVAVVLASLAVNLLDLEAHGVFRASPFTIPTAAWSDIPPLFLGAALAIAVVALADMMSTARRFAARRGERVYGNQETVGIGAANIAAGFFQGSQSARAGHAPRWPSRPGPTTSPTTPSPGSSSRHPRCHRWRPGSRAALTGFAAIGIASLVVNSQ